MSQQILTQFFKSASRSISNKWKPDVYGDHHETTITNKMQSTRTNANKHFQYNWTTRFPWVRSSQNATIETVIITGLYQTL